MARGPRSGSHSVSTLLWRFCGPATSACHCFRVTASTLILPCIHTTLSICLLSAPRWHFVLTRGRCIFYVDCFDSLRFHCVNSGHPRFRLLAPGTDLCLRALAVIIITAAPAPAPRIIRTTIVRVVTSAGTLWTSTRLIRFGGRSSTRRFGA